VARASRQFHLDLIAVGLLAFSILAHVIVRARRGARIGQVAWASLILGLLVAAAPVSGAMAHGTAVVVKRGAALLDAASPTANAVGTLREGEVLPILERAAVTCASRTLPARAGGPSPATCARCPGRSRPRPDPMRNLIRNRRFW
jgi:hypothetical protein